MDKLRIRQGIIIITYAALLVLVITNFGSVVAGVKLFFSLLTPFFVGMVIAFVLNRPYERMKELYCKKLGMKQGAASTLSVITVYLLLVGCLIAVVMIVVPQLVQNVQMLAASMDDAVYTLQNFLNNITQALGMRKVDLSELAVYLENYMGEIQDLVKTVIPKIAVVTMNVVSGVVNIFLAVAFSIYLMNGKNKIIAQVERTMKVLIPQKLQSGMYTVTHTVITVFENYVAGQALEALILGSLCFIGMLVLRLDYAGMISVVVAITAMIPILGAYVGGALAVILLLCVSVNKAILFLIFFVILQQVENNIIYPRVVGNKIGLPGIWVLMGITIGGKLMGIVGMLFGVPITTIVYILLKKGVRRREDEIIEEVNEG